MRKLTGLAALVAAMALGAVPASAGLPVPDQGNSSGITQGNNNATGGAANATGGDGGNADTGNRPGPQRQRDLRVRWRSGE